MATARALNRRLPLWPAMGTARSAKDLINGFTAENPSREQEGYPMPKTEKRFDAVAMMRTARDEISAAIEGMTLEEEVAWLASREIEDPFLRRLRDLAAERARLPAAADR